MKETSPPRAERFAWLRVLLWAVLIFFTVPMARSIQKVVADTVGRSAFSWIVVSLVLMGLLFAVWRARQGRWKITRGQWLVLLLIAGYYIRRTFMLRAAPEEAMHFVEYGLLAVWVSLAVRFRIKDFTLYLLAWLICILIGTCDEILQWIVPKRFWDLRDINLNATGSGLMLLAMAFGIRPNFLAEKPTLRSWARVVGLLFAVVFLLGASLQNTPHLVQKYAQWNPRLKFLESNPSTMAEYGYFIDAGDGVTFKSRLTAHELRAHDQVNATTAAALVDQYVNPHTYQDFLRTVTSVRDPFVHELRVRFARRDTYFNRGENEELDLKDRNRYYDIAFFEQRILESYFTNTMQQSLFKLPSHRLTKQQHWRSPNEAYFSRVSAYLITNYSQRQALYVWLLALSGLAVVWFGLKVKGPKKIPAKG